MIDKGSIRAKDNNNVIIHDLVIRASTLRWRVGSVVEHSSATPKVPSSILGPVSYQGHGL